MRQVYPLCLGKSWLRHGPPRCWHGVWPSQSRPPVLGLDATFGGGGMSEGPWHQGHFFWGGLLSQGTQMSEHKRAEMEAGCPAVGDSALLSSPVLQVNLEKLPTPQAASLWTPFPHSPAEAPLLPSPTCQGAAAGFAHTLGSSSLEGGRV